MDKYIAAFAIFIIIISLIVYVLIGITINLTLRSQWYENLTKSVVEMNVNRYVFVVIFFIASLFPYLALFNNCPSLNYLLIGAMISFFWIVILYLGQNISVSVWLVVPVFLYYLWLFSYLWWRNAIAAAFLIPLLVYIIFIFYHLVHLAFTNNIIL